MQQRVTEWNQTCCRDTDPVYGAPALQTELPGRQDLKIKDINDVL